MCLRHILRATQLFWSHLTTPGSLRCKSESRAERTERLERQEREERRGRRGEDDSRRDKMTKEPCFFPIVVCFNWGGTKEAS